MSEFTGERVVPGQIEVDLWNEHIARYAFAARLAVGKAVLDLGCGTGYGSAELACAARSVQGVDISAEAIAFARANYKLPNLEFAVGSCTNLSFGAATFDLVVSFEVIEHLQDWATLIREARRVLREDGLFVVSTPNRLYYAESREKAGPNPFHEHEFEMEEFRAALTETFPHVVVLLQNRTECMAFYPPRAGWGVDARMDASAGTAEEAHFFVAVCSLRPMAEMRNFVFVPRAANILREREQHIAKLKGELDLNRRWLVDVRGERDGLHQALKNMEEHLEGQNRWAQDLEPQLRITRLRIVEVEEAGLEVARQYEIKVAELESDLQSKVEWALDTEKRLTAEIEAERMRHRGTLDRLESAERTADERSRWALNLEDRLLRLETQMDLVRASRWIKVGRRLGVGPQL